jgi:hypothetical protein
LVQFSRIQLNAQFEAPLLRNAAKSGGLPDSCAEPYDQRIRNEGFDIEWMMMQAGLVPPLNPTPQFDAPPVGVAQ